MGNRTIDEVIEYIRRHPSIPPVHKQVLVNRVEVDPTKEELDRAHQQVYGD